MAWPVFIWTSKPITYVLSMVTSMLQYQNWIVAMQTICGSVQFSSIQFSLSVVSDSLPGRQGRVWLLPSAARFAFLPFPESISQVSGLCSPLCRCEEGSYSGLGGNTDWSKASWGSARVGRLRTALIPLGLAQAQGLTRSQLCHSVTCLKTSFQTLPHDETDVRG